MKLGDKLRSLREAQQWTQPHAAELIGIEQSYLSKLENDHSVPSMPVFRRIVDAYETDVAQLLDGIDPASVEQLSQISDVTDYINTERLIRQDRIRLRTRLQSMAVALGAGLIYAGVADLFFPRAVMDGSAWQNQAVVFVGIFLLTYGLLGLLVASTRQQRSSAST